MLISASFRIDTSGLTAMIAVAAAYSRRAPAVAVNTAAYVVATFAYAKTPVVGLSTIDTELGVTVTPIVPTPGVRKGSTNVTIDSRTSLAMKIVIARMHPNSKYSRLTGNRWPVRMPQTRGQRAFFGFVEEAAERMVRSRHSSAGFIRAGWIAPMQQLAASGSVSKSALRGREVATAARRGLTYDLGYAKPAVAGAVFVICEIANAVGTRSGGGTGALAEKHNEALWRIGAPALQAAIDDEFFNTVAYVAREEAKVFDSLKSKGWAVSI